MKCNKCGATLTDSNFCNNCGADVKIYKKLISASNALYNRGLEKATGDYIGLLDHDDYLTPDALYEMAEAIEKGKEKNDRKTDCRNVSVPAVFCGKQRNYIRKIIFYMYYYKKY